MVETTGRIKAGSVYGPDLEHYIVTASGPDFTDGAAADTVQFFDIITQLQYRPECRVAQIVLIGELKTTGHATNGQKFALEAGSGWTAATLTICCGCTIADYTY